MRLLGHVNRVVMLKGRFQLAHIAFPAADRERLRAAVNPSTAAFLAPNHPEFGLDWMLDKEISTHCAPEMAAWAAHEIIVAAPWFWARNNLVSNRGGRAAFDYSVDWALHGHGVLLHPEGMVRWTSDTVHPLFSGIADMAIEAARRANDRPVFIVPVVWKLHYTSDVSAGIHEDITHIERALGLADTRGESVSERFRLLQERILLHRASAFGISGLGAGDFFDRQARARRHILTELQTRHTVEPSDSLDRMIRRLKKVVRSRADRARVREAERLGSFTRERYGGPTLTQEQLYECLKRIRAELVRRGVGNAIHNALPKPYGRRVAHIRVAQPIRVDGSEDVPSLLVTLRSEMQRTLDALNVECAPLVGALRQANPFAETADSRTSHSEPRTIHSPAARPIGAHTRETSAIHS